MVMGFVLMFVWMLMLIVGHDAIYKLHSGLWGLHEVMTIETFCMANLIGIGLWKMGVMMFFAIPWLAIKFTNK